MQNDRLKFSLSLIVYYVHGRAKKLFASDVLLSLSWWGFVFGKWKWTQGRFVCTVCCVFDTEPKFLRSPVSVCETHYECLSVCNLSLFIFGGLTPYRVSVFDEPLFPLTSLSVKLKRDLIQSCFDVSLAFCSFLYIQSTQMNSEKPAEFFAWCISLKKMYHFVGE